LAKRGDLNSRRVAFKTIKNKEALTKLFDKLGPRFAKRNGGYTRIYHLGNRSGDAAKMAVLEWVDKESKDKKETKEKETKETKEKKKTPVKKEIKEKKAPAKKEAKKKAPAKKETKEKKETKAKKETKKKERSPKSKSK
jgi:large subunit ribosomal protein L17